MRKLREVIVVEGRYDKNTLSQVVDAVIVTVNGFSVFKDKETLALLRRLGRERGLIVLTDSDGAGFVIRNHLRSVLPKEQVKHAYIPDIYGKERRKRTAGKEGKLGVEGMKPEVLISALEKAGATFEDTGGVRCKPRQPVTKAEIEQIRGVKCDYSVQSLTAKGLIEEVGRKETLGRPILYGTTDAFLRHFCISSTADLPEIDFSALAAKLAAAGGENDTAKEDSGMAAHL